MKITIGAVVLAAALAAAGCSSSSSSPAVHKPATFTIVGTITVASPCDSLRDSGYSDITEGAQVKVTGPDGRSLAVGRLGAHEDPAVMADPSKCEFPFMVTHVRAGLRLYGITVASRGTLEYTRAELHARPVELTLGS